MIKLKDLLTEAPQIKKVKNVSVQYLDAEFQGETLHGFKYFKKGPWLYKKDNGEYFAVVITNKNNRYEIQLGKLKNNIQATAAVEKIIKKNLNKFESVNESKSDVLKSLSEIKSLIYSLYQEMSKVQKHLDPEDAQKIKKLMSKPLGDLDKSTTFIKSLSRKMESVNERSLVGDEYYGTAYLNYPVARDGTIDLYRSVEKDAHSNGKKYGIKKYDYYLIIRNTGKPGYVVDTNTHILDKAGKWAQQYIKRKLGGTGKERFT